jgi:hypothetical protein
MLNESKAKSAGMQKFWAAYPVKLVRRKMIMKNKNGDVMQKSKEQQKKWHHSLMSGMSKGRGSGREGSGTTVWEVVV